MKRESETPYRYRACGLDNVFIHGMRPVVDDEGDEVYEIPNINGLHCAIAREIVLHEGVLSGKELRFLRTEIGWTQAELGKFVHKEALTVGRWERGETEIDANANTLIRLLAIEKLKLKTKISTSELVGHSVPIADINMIDIDGSDPKKYRPLAA